MKNLKQLSLLLVIIAACYFTVQAQSENYTVNDKLLSDFDEEYMQIIETRGSMSRTILFDFGHSKKESEQKVKDEKGKYINFNSTIEAINLISQNGYEYVGSHTADRSGVNITYFIFRRIKD